METSPKAQRSPVVAFVAGALVAFAISGGVYWGFLRKKKRPKPPQTAALTTPEQPGKPETPAPLTGPQAQAILWDEVQPVALSNCNLKRYGGPHDGGYLMCENFVKGIESAYSYGIDQEDNWGCEVSKQAGGIPIHQYDCFTDKRPTCPEGKFVFHPECIGDKASTMDGKPFDTLSAQLAKNGDSKKRVIVKMDIEGAEWDSLLATPDEVFDNIDQLPMELHGVNQQKYIDLVKKLKRKFHLVSVHFNNHVCHPSDHKPFPSYAFQVLFVNKRIGKLDPAGKPHVPGTPPHAPDAPNMTDCQARVN
jgi:hypothetical protein